jgi:hypothetical protein
VRNIVGQAAKGDDFWKREDELEDIWREIEARAHVLLVAPRRVGKTSIMMYMLDNPKEGYSTLYVSTESAETEDEFWQKLFDAFQDAKFVGGLTKASSKLKQALGSIKSIGPDGIEFNSKKMDFAKAFTEIIKSVDDEKPIIMIDEFAQTIENIIKKEGKESAISLLHTVRELRQNPHINDKFSFVYAGSIGLESIVSKLDVPKTINDVVSIKILPLREDEAKAFSQAILKTIDITLPPKILAYMLDRIEWRIPFYIQMIIKEIKLVIREYGNEPISSTHIDKAFDNAIKNRNYFEHWEKKLEHAFIKEEVPFAKAVLNHAAKYQKVTYAEIHNLMDKYGLSEQQLKDVITTLVYDGYIHNNENHKIYRFNSPILKMWWLQNVA